MDKHDITMDDLTENDRRIAEVIGLDSFYSLSEMCGGTRIYVPEISDMIRIKKYKLIQKELNESNELDTAEIAVKYGVSESTVYRLMKSKVINNYDFDTSASVDGLRLTDLSGISREIAETIGISTLYQLSNKFGGRQIYIPKSKDIAKSKVYELIKNEFDPNDQSKSAWKLAKKYGVSFSTIYRLCYKKGGNL